MKRAYKWPSLDIVSMRNGYERWRSLKALFAAVITVLLISIPPLAVADRFSESDYKPINASGEDSKFDASNLNLIAETLEACRLDRGCSYEIAEPQGVIAEPQGVYVFSCEEALELATGSEEERQLKAKQALVELEELKIRRGWKDREQLDFKDPELFRVLSPIYFANPEARFVAASAHFERIYIEFQGDPTWSALSSVYILDRIMSCSEERLLSNPQLEGILPRFSNEYPEHFRGILRDLTQRHYVSRSQ